MAQSRRSRRPPLDRRLLGRLVDALELPSDLLIDVPRVTIIGALQVTVENHRGLAAYRPDEVSIAVAGGVVRITGAELEIGVVQAHEVTVTGRVAGVAFLAD
ncbi:MAG: sporulation protein YqfC [Firmicutes bacterium]|nr:sporulation protein YqfC [Bacillota bacterium]